MVSALGQCATNLPFFLVKESIYPMHAKTSTTFTFWKKLLFGKTNVENKDIIVLHHPWYENYYHWTTECLPRLIPCLELYPDAYLLLPKKYNNFHLQQLLLLGIQKEKLIFIEADKQLLVKKAIIYPINNLRFGIHDVELLDKTFNRFRKSILPINSPSKRYYLTRKNAPKRKAINENEIIDCLSSQGFENIEVEKLSVREQFQLFASASIVVGVHGSYFVNAFCMAKGSLVIDIMEKNHDDNCYKNMLEPMGINYLFLLSEGVGDPSNFRDNDMFVDIVALNILIKNQE
jgi:capsular polysaccharide biosynthesis protein